ncbi:MAG: hypothetical protein ACR2M8_00160 [Pyrinomonadaceae bacterium]|jgi:DNA topoisomerase-1|nr:hypothetical protein [Blastocatellia bacterium]MDQ3220305.1 hypothetical protein [Acidobacteriota bacterium]MDQ3489843.1 hypothetical protein [Acidobacteriota bacterium]
MMEALDRSNYPKCDGVFWDKPVKDACPKCAAPYLLEKTTKKEGTFRYCKNEDCDYKMAVGNTDLTSDNAGENTASVAERAE